MKITVQRRGGIAAGIRRPPQTLDIDSLPPDEALELDRRIAAVGSSPVVEAASGPAPDAVSYTITADQDGAVRTWRASDGRMSEAFTDLLEWLERRLPGPS